MPPPGKAPNKQSGSDKTQSTPELPQREVVCIPSKVAAQVKNEIIIARARSRFNETPISSATKTSSPPSSGPGPSSPSGPKSRPYYDSMFQSNFDLGNLTLLESTSPSPASGSTPTTPPAPTAKRWYQLQRLQPKLQDAKTEPSSLNRRDASQPASAAGSQQRSGKHQKAAGVVYPVTNTTKDKISRR